MIAYEIYLYHKSNDLNVITYIEYSMGFNNDTELYRTVSYTRHRKTNV